MSGKNDPVVITGGFGALGTEVVRYFIEKGADVVTVERAAKPPDDFAGRMPAGANVHSHCNIDLSDATAAGKAIADIGERSGAIRAGRSGDCRPASRPPALPSLRHGSDFVRISSRTNSREGGSSQHAQRSRMPRAIPRLGFVSLRHPVAPALSLCPGTRKDFAAKGASGLGPPGDSLARKARLHATAGGLAPRGSARARGE